MTRRGYTLVEGALAVGLLGLFVALAWQLRGGLAGRAARLEDEGDAERARALLGASLRADLEAGLPLDVLGTAPGPGGPELELPVAAGYAGDGEPALRFRRVVYRFDPARGALERDGRVLVGQGLAKLDFRVEGVRPARLVVEGEGRGLPAFPWKLALALPEPGDDWVPAPPHRGALEVTSRRWSRSAGP